MNQYLNLGESILIRGTYKAPARENMPGTLSLFGAQFRCDLADGFPILTTKKLSFKNIVTELLWFMKGDTNIKFLVDNGCNIWNEDAYNYYKKQYYKQEVGTTWNIFDFEEFVSLVKTRELKTLINIQGLKNYTLGDCGKQYGWLWRNWESIDYWMNGSRPMPIHKKVDQLQELVDGLIKSPTSRRHIITAWNPATLDDMALNACHAFVQFNCRPLNTDERRKLFFKQNAVIGDESEINEEDYDNVEIPKYYLDCQLYQRSADYILGVPYNIASYALLTHILSEVTNMVPGEFIHTFGDVHIYDNHMEAVKEQLSRQPSTLPKLHINTEFWNPEGILTNKVAIFDGLKIEDFSLEGYTPQPSIKAKLSTGLV